MVMSAESKWFFVLGCVFLATAGALAAFGFHGPADILTPAKRASWVWAVEMQYYHSAGLLVVGLLIHLLGSSWLVRAAGVLMIAGIVVFSGLIYAGTLGAPEAFGEVVPSGGFMLMLSWLVLAAGVLRTRVR
jgi:uncharacterized membrane protein YgdD (TMEM256/DUF423 family)